MAEVDSVSERSCLNDDQNMVRKISEVSLKDWLIFVLCLLELLLFGGTIFGWPSLAYVYKDIGVYSTICGANKTQNGTAIPKVCPDQSGMLPLAFNVGMAFFSINSVISGVILDRFGLRPTRVGTIIAGVLGTLCLAFASKETPFLIFPGVVLVGSACGSMLVVNNYIAQVMRNRASAAIVICNGVFNSSGVVYFIVKVAYEHGFPQRWMLILIACSWVMVICTTFCLLPPHKLKIDNSISYANKGVQSISTDSIWKHIRSSKYISHVLYCIKNHMWLGIVLGNMNTWLSHVYDGNQMQVSKYVNIYAYIQLASGLLLCPVTGGLTDVVQKSLHRSYGPRLPPTALAVIAAPGMLLASIFYIIVGVALIVAQTSSVFAVFISNEIGRAFFYGSITAYVALVFPSEHFGILYGLVAGSWVITLVIQYAYVCWIQSSGFIPAISLSLGLTILSLLHPIFIIVRNFWTQSKASKGTQLM